MIQNKMILLLGGVLLILLSSFMQDSIWTAPDVEAKKKNPIESSEKSLKTGMKLYGKICWSCHGVDGKGDGPAGASLNPKPADFSKLVIQDQTDGALYWKLSTGRGNMTGYENSLTDDQRWAIVNHLRTLDK